MSAGPGKSTEGRKVSRPSKYFLITSHHLGHTHTNYSLEKLRQRHIKKEGKYARFTQPAAYEPAGGGVYIMKLGPAPANYDPHVGKSPTLLRLKQQMPRWLWDVCHRAMDRVDDRADPYVGESGRFSQTRHREGPMQTAALRLAKSYPARPAELVPSSPTVDRLREILAEAPRLPVDLGLGAHSNGFTVTETGWPEYDYEYEWAPTYLDRLFGALIEVIEAHGTGDGGWRSVRWEVYDKVRLVSLGLFVQPVNVPAVL